jgi:hypothetical protein
LQPINYILNKASGNDIEVIKEALKQNPFNGKNVYHPGEGLIGS